jgi:hypothetical protein
MARGVKRLRKDRGVPEKPNQGAIHGVVEKLVSTIAIACKRVTEFDIFTFC